MLCENKFCIYWKLNHCTLDEISLDISGRCLECIYVPISEDELQAARKKCLDLYDKIYEQWEINDT